MEKAVGAGTGGHHAFRLTVVSPSVIQETGCERCCSHQHCLISMKQVTDTKMRSLIATNSSCWQVLTCHWRSHGTWPLPLTSQILTKCKIFAESNLQNPTKLKNFIFSLSSPVVWEREAQDKSQVLRDNIQHTLSHQTQFQMDGLPVKKKMKLSKCSRRNNG